MCIFFILQSLIFIALFDRLESNRELYKMCYEGTKGQTNRQRRVYIYVNLWI